MPGLSVRPHLRVRTRIGLCLVATATATALSGCASSGEMTKDSGSDTSTIDAESGPTSSTPTSATPQPFNASGLLAGDAKPDLPDGKPGQVSVVAQAPLDSSYGSGTLVFAFRNNTDETIASIDWSATARAGGKLVATGSSQYSTAPALVGPGEIGMDYIYFDSTKQIPDSGATYELTPNVTTMDDSMFGPVPFTVGEISRNGNTIIGSATNKTQTKASGPYAVDVYCFDGNDLVGQTTGFAEEENDVQPGGVVNFTVDLYVNNCQTYALGVAGNSL